MKTLGLFGFLLISISISSQNLSEGLQGHYQFNLNLEDLSPNNIKGEAFNVIEATGLENTQGSCYEYNGIDSYINLDSSHRNITNSVAVSVWVKTSSSERAFAVSKYNSEALNGFFMGVQDGLALLGGRLNKTDFIQLFSNSTIDDNEWHHIVGIINNAKWELWVDCILVASINSNNIEPNFTNSEPLTIGRWHQGNGMGEFRNFNGNIDEFRIYNRSILVEDINILCNKATVSNKGINDNHQDINIFPNPVSSSLNIKVNTRSYSKLKYTLVNSHGEVVESGHLKHSVTISNLISGIYTLLIYNTYDIIAIEKIIKI
jgi:hypothetical protein